MSDEAKSQTVPPESTVAGSEAGDVSFDHIRARVSHRMPSQGQATTADGVVIDLRAGRRATDHVSANGRRPASAGVATLSSSGVATVASGTSSVTVMLPLFAPEGVVFATLQRSLKGVCVQGVSKAAGSFTIDLTRAVTADVEVGWFVLG
jgi:hypothetical protein